MNYDKADRRIEKTRRLLSESLMTLMLEKRYDRITVQDIIDRANVGRSTFYAHYPGKEELLLSGIEHLSALLAQQIERGVQNDRLILPTREIFAHVQE